MMQRDSPVDELVVLDIVLFTIMPGLCLECAWYCSVTLYSAVTNSGSRRHLISHFLDSLL